MVILILPLSPTGLIYPLCKQLSTIHWTLSSFLGTPFSSNISQTAVTSKPSLSADRLCKQQRNLRVVSCSTKLLSKGLVGINQYWYDSHLRIGTNQRYTEYTSQSLQLGTSLLYNVIHSNSSKSTLACLSFSSFKVPSLSSLLEKATTWRL